MDDIVGRLEVRCDPIEVTLGGLSPAGPPPDMIRRFVAGPPHYFLDGREITEAHYEALIRDAMGHTERRADNA
jgi:hypothetical protein